MKKLGAGMAIAGVVMWIGSFVLFGSAIAGALEGKVVAAVPLEINTKHITDVITVETDKSCQISIKLDVQTNSVQEEENEFDNTTYKPRYRFPVSYKVTDSTGKLIFSETAKVGWDGKGTRYTRNKQVGKSGGTINVEQYLEKFDVPPPGQIKVEIEVKNDTDYGAQANRVELKVYDNIPKHGDTTTGIAALSCCFAPGFVVIGAMLFLIGWLGGRNKSAS